MFENTNPTGTVAWHKLRDHFFEMQSVKIQDLFAGDTERVEKFHIQWNDFILDFSKNKIEQKTLNLLIELANEVSLKDAIKAKFSGKFINQTEKRAVLHTALRDKNCQEEVAVTLKKIEEFTNDVISGKLLGTSNKKFTDVVNIGIGGSDLGPKIVVESLVDYKNHLNIHYISNIDFDTITRKLNEINPETTLIIIVSKSFGTIETLKNAEIVKNWLIKNGMKTENHIVAVSSNLEKSIAFGIKAENIFHMWDWVGGRFSLWSAVGLSISLSLGFTNFKQLLEGAYEMDEHFKETPFNKNIPVVLALLSVWYNNFFNYETEAIIPYSDNMKSLPAYLQQVIMESNGKNINRDGIPVNYETGTIIWGEVGTNSQHAFFQLFHQGTKVIPTDFIGFIEPFNKSELHDLLMANFFAQTEALMNGKDGGIIAENNENDENAAFKSFKGNKPSNTILIKKLTPKTLGSLLAMYEHKTFVQGVIWNIYSFDQFGVEYGKKLAENIFSEIKNNDIGIHDCSTTFLLKKYLNN
nr:glucose-6-phosphate isomerase [uncultured Flavobacterium sp.]